MEEKLPLVVVVFPCFKSLKLSTKLLSFAFHGVDFEIVENGCLVVFLGIFCCKHSKSDLVIEIVRITSPGIKALVELVEVFSPDKSLNLSLLSF